MVFTEEPTQYTKTGLSDLQGAWQNLRDDVVRAWPFPESQRMLFHIDEGMSWESVRNLERMRGTLVLIENIISQSECPAEVAEGVETVRENLEEVFEAIAAGEVI